MVQIGIKIRRVFHNQRGSVFIDGIIMLLVTATILLSIFEMFAMLLQYQNISYMAKSVTKVVEQEGALTGVAYDKLNALNHDFGTDATLEISDVTYFNSGERSIQFRDPFTITIKDQYTLEVLSPLFSDPVVINIPMQATISGMSEVYWKER